MDAHGLGSVKHHLAVVALAAELFLIPAADASAQLPPLDSGLIVYVGHDNRGIPQIFTIAPDGSRNNQLTFSSGGNLYPAWSPDGTRIAFTSMRTGTPQLWTMSADGTNQVAVTELRPPGGGFVPSWGPGGSRIVFSASASDPITPPIIPQGIGSPVVLSHLDLWVIDAGGTNLTRLTVTVPGDSNAPSWSPEESRIAFASNRSGVPEVYSMRPDGTDVRQLTWPTPPIFPSSNVPVWSPDGSRLAFWSGIEAFFGQVWVMNADGTNRHVLTNCPPPTNCDNPAWSPDGRFLLFETNRSHSAVETWVMNADGTDQHLLLPFPYGAGRQPWQPVIV